MKLKPQKPKPEKVKPKKAEKAAETREASAPRADADNGAKVAASKRVKLPLPLASFGLNGRPGCNLIWRGMLVSCKASPATPGGSACRLGDRPFGECAFGPYCGLVGRPSGGYQLALEAARRASPVPAAPPAAIAKARMPITMPLLFQVSRGKSRSEPKRLFSFISIRANIGPYPPCQDISFLPSAGS